MADTYRACAAICGGQFAGFAFTLRPTAVMLVTEAKGADESNSPKRVNGSPVDGGASAVTEEIEVADRRIASLGASGVNVASLSPPLRSG